MAHADDTVLNSEQVSIRDTGKGLRRRRVDKSRQGKPSGRSRGMAEEEGRGDMASRLTRQGANDPALWAICGEPQ